MFYVLGDCENFSEGSLRALLDTHLCVHVQLEELDKVVQNWEENNEDNKGPSFPNILK